MNNIPTSEHFTIEELCRSQVAVCLGIDNEPKREGIIANLKRLAFHTLEAVRLLNDSKPITITSGYRCKELNRAVGGVATSQHQNGCAADFVVGSAEENRKLFGKIKSSGSVPFDQLILEPKAGWIHISYVEGGNRFQIIDRS